MAATRKKGMKSRSKNTTRRINKKATVQRMPVVSALVNKIVNRKLETKYATDLRNAITFNSGISGWNEAYPLLPPVPEEGTTPQSFARVNDQISPLSLKLDLNVAINAVSRSVAVRVDVFVLTYKLNKYWPSVSLLPGAPQLFRTGTVGAQTTAYDGRVSTSFLRMNLNSFTVIKRKSFLLGGNVGFPNGDTVNGNAPNMSLAGMSKKLSMIIPCPNTLKYDESSATSVTYPNNYAPFLFIGYSKVDGASPDVSFQSVVASWNASLTYKDA